MKPPQKLTSLKLSLLLSLVLGAMSLPALAGGPQTYLPVHSRQELSALKPGTSVAHECPHCGAITITKADKAHSQADGFTCPVCKMKITYRDTAAGKGPKLNMVDCVDAKTGKKMTARVCAMH